MKYLKFFENHSNLDSLKNEILNLGIKKLAYDIIDASFDNLDIIERDDEGEIMEKSLIFEIYIEKSYFDINDNIIEYLESIINCSFNLNECFSEDNIIWIPNNQNELESIINDIKSKNKIGCLLSVIAGEEGDKKQLNCGDILEKLESLYPNIEFGTFDPWDIN